METAAEGELARLPEADGAADDLGEHEEPAAEGLLGPEPQADGASDDLEEAGKSGQTPTVDEGAKGLEEADPKDRKPIDDGSSGEDAGAAEGVLGREPQADGASDDLAEAGKSGLAPTADEVRKPIGGDLKNSGEGGEEPIVEEVPTSGDRTRMPSAVRGSSGEEAAERDVHSPDCGDSPGAWRSAPSISVRALVSMIGTAGEMLQASCSYVAGYHGSVLHLSDFLRRVGTYAPNSGIRGSTPAALSQIAEACSNLSAFLGHAAGTVHGVTGMGQLLGAGLSRAARLYGPEVVTEAEPKPEPVIDTLKITINSVEQAQKVIKWIVDGPDLSVHIDVGLDVTPFMAVKIYEEFRSHGMTVLSLISGSTVVNAKREAFFEESS